MDDPAVHHHVTLCALLVECVCASLCRLVLAWDRSFVSVMIYDRNVIPRRPLVRLLRSSSEYTHLLSPWFLSCNFVVLLAHLYLAGACCINVGSTQTGQKQLMWKFVSSRCEACLRVNTHLVGSSSLSLCNVVLGFSCVKASSWGTQTAIRLRYYTCFWWCAGS